MIRFWRSCSFCLVLCIAISSIAAQTEAPCRLGDLRLLGGSSNLTGRVEICHEGVWGTICDDRWDDDDARVVCRQLGHSDLGARAIISSNSEYPIATGPILLDNVQCEGDEDYLINCTSLGFRQHDCTHLEDAGVECQIQDFSCEDGDVRLDGGVSMFEGRVEMCRDNKYMTICDSNNWGRNEATVVCRQLNFTTGGSPFAVGGGRFGLGIGDILSDNIQCDGSESDLGGCSFTNNFFSVFCSHFDDVGVLCPQPDPSCEYGSIRLVGSSEENEGRVEVCINGHWGTVCHDGWGVPDAQVVCRQLGYPTENSFALGFGDFGVGTNLILFTSFSCNGSEDSLLDCPNGGVGEHFCTHSQDAGLICMDPNNTCIEGSMRLADGETANEGRLEVCYSNHWGTVCDDEFSSVEAAIVCRELGYSTEGAIGLHSAYFGSGVGLILLDNLDCDGNETSLLNCSHLGIATSNCFHNEDVSVLCQGVNVSCINGDVRLVNGTGPHSGRVEVCFNGRWGSICDDDWGRDDAEVVCNQLGFPGESVGLQRAYFGEGSGPIFLDDTDCSPLNHSNIVECFDVATSVGAHNCDHSEDAGVICSFGNRTCDGQPNGAIRLADGSSDMEGRVELCLDGMWGTICDNFWSHIDAVVVCNQLSFGKTDAIAVQGAHFGPGTGAIHLDGFFCNGAEESLVDCFHRNPGNSACTHAQDASVICLGITCSDGDIRLVDGQFPSEGRVEVCVEEQFGTVCDFGWDSVDAGVVCRQLQYSGEGAVALPSAFFGRGTRGIAIGNAECTGEEDSLLNCPNDLNPFCFHFNDASVLCQSENASLVCTNGDIRLAGSGVPYEGLVEVCFNGQWGTVCHDSWDRADAQTVCGILGYNDTAIQTTFSFFGDGANIEGPVFLDEVQCNGNETSILDCLSVAPGDHDCSHFIDAGVICSVSNSSFECDTGDVRLVNGETKLEGRVEVCLNGKWGTVCDNGWGSREASVVCGQLGYDPSRSIARRRAAFGAGTLPIFLSSLGCTGDEDNLVMCSGLGPGVNCRHSEDAGVICTEFDILDCTDGDVRLVGGIAQSEGTVEVCVDNFWGGTICDSSWDSADAAVICQQLGYPSEGAQPLYNAFYGSGIGSVLATDVSCLGNESSVVECSNTTENTCLHTRDAGVICLANVSRDCEDGSVRLTGSFGGRRRYQGAVELCLRGNWGLVCDDDWSRLDGKVVCKQLGFEENELNGVAFVVGENFFASRNNMVVLHNTACTGDESSLLECPASPIGSRGCSARAGTAGVFCPTPNRCTNGEVRLVDMVTEGEGKVEICLGGSWTAHCPGGEWDDNDAQVICRQLGYPNPEGAVSIFGDRGGSEQLILIPLACNGTEESLSDCPTGNSSFFDSFLCQVFPAPAAVLCIVESCNDGEIRLMNGTTENEGRVEICFDSEWGTICDDSWDTKEATVVCRQLGYPDTLLHLALHGGFFGRGLDAIHLDELGCDGDEVTLADCSHSGIGEHNCLHEEDAGVVCSIPNGVCVNGALRLVGGRNSNEGRVEVCFGGRWGTICDDLWDQNDAMVICGQLGLARFGAIHTDTVLFGQGSGFIFLDDLACFGNETMLLDCQASDPGLHNCDHSEDVGVICNEISGNCDNGDVRIISGGAEFQGTVQICLGRSWGSICDTNWGDADAAVICRQLNYIPEGSVGVPSALFGSGSQDVIITDVMCLGNETRLLDCPFQNSSSDSCLHAGVICRTSADMNCTSGDARLVDGETPSEGRVEVCVGGNWGTVCNDGWDASDAAVICRQLGYTDNGTAIPVRSRGFFGSGTGFIVLDNLDCDGTELTLTSCSRAETGASSCNPYDDAAVICPDEVLLCSNGDVRLVSSTKDPASGRFEVCIGNRWTSICGDTQWDNQEARVACRQLGFNDVENATSVVVSGGEGPVFFSGVQCRGGESSIFDCSIVVERPPEFSSCFIHSSDAGVICNVSSNCSDGDVRLNDGDIPNVGRVEICFNNRWGTVCDDNWGEQEATVVCRQLGYTQLMDSVAVREAYFGRGITAIHLDDLECTGDEASLADCTHNGVGIHNCNNEEDAGVICIAENDVCSHGDLRLVNGLVEASGMLEVCIGGVWGSVCDDGFDLVDAGVACRLLGHLSEDPQVFNATMFGFGTDLILLDDIECVGNETSILDCDREGAGIHNCGHREDVGLLCRLAPLCEDGDIRLVGGEIENEGTLNICINEAWGTVCDDLWDNNDASVVCRQLGYPAEGAVSVRGAFFGSLEGSILVSNVQCNGSEGRLLNCQSLRDGFFCFHNEDAGVICQSDRPLSCTTGDVRLAEGSNQYEGRVELCLHGRWGTICDDDWDGYDAAVVCRQLGYTENGAPYAISNAAFGSGEGFIILDSIGCVGNETSLLGCRADEIGTHNCLPIEDAGVFCPYPGSPCMNGAVRLVGGEDESSGRVEICLGGTWGTMCGGFTRDTIAEVICRQLGFSENATYPVTQTSASDLYGIGTGAILVSSPTCQGTESRITDCSQFNNGNLAFCEHSNDIGVDCQIRNDSTLCSTGDVRLVEGAVESEGRVEICESNRWGTVCDDDWDQNEALVVCRQLGFAVLPENAIPVLRGFFGGGASSIHLDSTGCNGSEPNLLACPHDGVGVHNCGHAEDAGVICIVDSAFCDYGEVRLAKGETELEGRVEVCLGGRYGTVCDDDWDDIDASVVCRQLGFSPQGAEGLGSALFGQGVENPIFLDDTGCLGNETGLIFCPHSGAGQHNCFHFEDAGVRCQPIPCTSNTFRLVGGLNSSSGFNGQVEVCVDRRWGPVCSDSVTETDLQYICGGLGGSPDLSILTPGDLFITPEQSSDIFYNISSTCLNGTCTFTTNATSCSGSSSSGRLGAICPIALSAGVGAPVVCETGSVRLAGGRTAMEGRVEICFDDQWGTVCDDSWDCNGAAVVCNQLGLPYEGSVSECVESFGAGVGPIWLDDVKCIGTEGSLFSCSQIPLLETHNCQHSEDAGVRCLAPPMTTEAPPMTTEAPPMTTEAPPMMTEAPPMMTEAPSMTTEAPTKITQTPKTDTPPSKEPTKEPTKFTDKPISAGAQTGGGSSSVIIPLVIVIVLLLIIVVLIVVVIIIVVVVRSSRRKDGILKFNNDENNDNNNLVESDFLGREADDIPMTKK